MKHATVSLVSSQLALCELSTITYVRSLSPFFRALYSNSTHLSRVSSPVLDARWELSILCEKMRGMGLVGLRGEVISALASLLPLGVWELKVRLGGRPSVAWCCSPFPLLLPLLVGSQDTGGGVDGRSSLEDFASFLAGDGDDLSAMEGTDKALPVVKISKKMQGHSPLLLSPAPGRSFFHCLMSFLPKEATSLPSHFFLSVFTDRPTRDRCNGICNTHTHTHKKTTTTTQQHNTSEMN